MIAIENSKLKNASGKDVSHERGGRKEDTRYLTLTSTAFIKFLKSPCLQSEQRCWAQKGLQNHPGEATGVSSSVTPQQTLPAWGRPCHLRSSHCRPGADTPSDKVTLSESCGNRPRWRAARRCDMRPAIPEAGAAPRLETERASLPVRTSFIVTLFCSQGRTTR